MRFVVVGTLQRGALPEPEPLDESNQFRAQEAYWRDAEAMRHSPQNTLHWQRIERQMKAS